MLSPKRAAPLLCITAFTLTLLYLRAQETGSKWRDSFPISAEEDIIPEERILSTPSLLEDQSAWSRTPIFAQGTPKPHGSNYTRALIIPRTTSEDVSWITTENLSVIPLIYTVDDPKSPLRTPRNKGHEVMVYLTYIITHYTTLPDISIFMHAHRHSWHNNELLNNDAAEMIRRLSSEHVVRSGYTNLRCHWNPGCPDWMHPGVTEDDINKQEENLMVQAWAELFPGEAIPISLAQPCCAQFAVSRERIRATPLARWVFFREWLLRTELNDHLSGRIWEYLWQVVFTGEAWVCADQHVCYCDGYGVCFEDGAAFERWFEIRGERDRVNGELEGWNAKVEESKQWAAEGKAVDGMDPGMGKEEELRKKVEELDRELEDGRNKAVERGASARMRAMIVGRPWSDGDGF